MEMSQGLWWTAEEDAQLIALRQQGIYLRNIARQIGREYTSVKSRLRTLRDEGKIADCLKRQRKPTELSSLRAEEPIGHENYEISQREADIAACDKLLALLRAHHKTRNAEGIYSRS